MNDSKAFWASQSSSLNRDADPEFYRRKADEHAALMTVEERAAGSVDLGCGAGEMLVHLATEVKICAGVDFSEPMLAAARAVLAGTDIDFVSVDIFDFLPTTSIPVWMTTGALNQYLAENDLEKVLKIFSKNPTARTFFLFDCIDPIRYKSMPLGIGYCEFYTEKIPTRPFRRKLSKLVYRGRFAAAVMLSTLERDVQKLQSAAMGYAVVPGFWRRKSEELDLSIEMVSSKYYEYRYHVILRKQQA